MSRLWDDEDASIPIPLVKDVAHAFSCQKISCGPSIPEAWPTKEVDSILVDIMGREEASIGTMVSQFWREKL
jgi:hypothetical protein